MIAARHSRLRETVMMDWLRSLNERGVDTLPSSTDIMARFEFNDTEAARTLIAQLADAGVIRVRRFNGGASFTILPPRPPRCAVSTVNRAVEPDADDETEVEDLPLTRREARQVDTAVAKIAAAMARKLSPVSAKKQQQIIPEIIPMPERPKVETADLATEVPADALSPPVGHPSRTEVGEPPAQAAEVQEQAREPAPQPVEARQPKRPRGNARVAQVATLAERRQMNLHLSPELFEAVRAAAEREGCTAAEFARRALGERIDPPVKPRITGAMLRALREDGRPFDQFFAEMVMLGIETARALRARGEAA